jgi:LacI family transcriptional regulator
MRVRIKDIARLAEVSPGTVDRVIHNRGEVSEITRSKVKRILQELDYQPDILASTLAHKRSILFSVIMPVSANGSDFWQAPNLGIEKAVKELAHFGISVQGYYFDMFNKESFISCCNELLNDKPDAVLMAPLFPEESVSFILRCQSMNIPVTIFNSRIDEMAGVNFIGQDSQQSGLLAAKLITWGMASSGDILILNMAGRNYNHKHILERERGFRSYFVTNSLSSLNLHTIELTQATEEAFKKHLDKAFSHLRVKGVFVTNSRVHRVGCYFNEMGVRNVRLIGYDLLPENIRFLKEGVIDFLISQKPEEQGYLGIRSLFAKCILKTDVPDNQFIPIDIITRENIDFYEYR